MPTGQVTHHNGSQWYDIQWDIQWDGQHHHLGSADQQRLAAEAEQREINRQQEAMRASFNR